MKIEVQILDADSKEVLKNCGTVLTDNLPMALAQYEADRVALCEHSPAIFYTHTLTA